MKLLDWLKQLFGISKPVPASIPIPITIPISEPAIPSPLITENQLHAIALNAKEGQFAVYMDALNATLQTYGITTPLRIAHFIAQCMHESMEFTHMQEIADGSAYEGRRDLGNTEPGDGPKFKGRGALQITGRENYQLYGTAKKMSFIANPGLVALTPYCIDVAGWYWDLHRINGIADRDNLVAVTHEINGGVRGLDQRRSYLLRAKTVLGIG